jgi:hypothetical protein
VEASTLISFAVEVSTFEAANSSKDSGSASKPARISYISTKKAGWAPFDFSAFWIIKANIFTVSSSSSTRGFLEANEYSLLVKAISNTAITVKATTRLYLFRTMRNVSLLLSAIEASFRLSFGT